MAELAEQHYEVVSLDEVRQHPDNPRRGDLDAIKASVDRNGFYGALIVQRSSGYILAGNHRYLAAKASGLTELPVLFVDADVDQARRIMVADNRTSDLAINDEASLLALLRSIGEEDLSGTGYDADALAKLVARVEPTSPDDFKDLDPDNLPIEHRCPACGYEWSGNPTPETAIAEAGV